jgi:RHS repeat-associated protein
MYMLQDANYNVVALVDASGVLLEQYAYDPYGTVVAADNVDEGGATAHAINRVGFQGLFFERYDGDYTQPCIAPNVAGMYYARARFYSPALGRFLQRDPNETGIPIIAALAMNGEAVAILFGGFGADGLYGDGMNLYLFAGANPANRRDPSGLTAGTYADQGMALEVGAWVEAAMAAGGRLAALLTQKVVGRALAYAWMMTSLMLMASNNLPAISTAGAEYGEDYVHLDRMWQAAKKAGSECWGSFTRAIGGSSGSFDPNRLPGGWERFRHTLTPDKAGKWFGISDPSQLSLRQIQEWQDLLGYALRSERTFNWDSNGAPTIARLVFVDGKHLCVQVYQATGELATAFIPNPAELEAMQRALGL